jgi:hypothetical protein
VQTRGPLAGRGEEWIAENADAHAESLTGNPLDWPCAYKRSAIDRSIIYTVWYIIYM